MRRIGEDPEQICGDHLLDLDAKYAETGSGKRDRVSCTRLFVSICARFTSEPILKVTVIGDVCQSPVDWLVM